MDVIIKMVVITVMGFGIGRGPNIQIAQSMAEAQATQNLAAQVAGTEFYYEAGEEAELFATKQQAVVTGSMTVARYQISPKEVVIVKQAETEVEVVESLGVSEKEFSIVTKDLNNALHLLMKKAVAEEVEEYYSEFDSISGKIYISDMVITPVDLSQGEFELNVKFSIVVQL